MDAELAAYIRRGLDTWEEAASAAIAKSGPDWHAGTRPEIPGGDGRYIVNDGSQVIMQGLEAQVVLHAARFSPGSMLAAVKAIRVMVGEAERIRESGVDLTGIFTPLAYAWKDRVPGFKPEWRILG